MTATLAGTERSSARTSGTISTGTHRQRGSAPLARPQLARTRASSLARTASRGSIHSSACHVTSPAALRAGLFLKVKVATVVVLALVGAGVSVAEFASWSEVDPAVEFVAGDPAWAHVTGR